MQDQLLPISAQSALYTGLVNERFPRRGRPRQRRRNSHGNERMSSRGPQCGTPVTVDILLATYNGARFLPEQLASLEEQTYSCWRLIARDDGSDDDSPAIIEEFATRHGEKVRVLRDGRRRLGARGNFAALMEASDAPYFMFCDQDDVWLPNKIADLLRTLRAVEQRRGVETPILAHSDLVLIDAERRVLHPSFWRYSRLLDPQARRRPLRMMLENYVTGCASIGNAALRRAALPIPPEARLHDWWVALTAAMLGEIAEHDTATILYRQHLANEVGAKSGTLLASVDRIMRTRGRAVGELRQSLVKSEEQAAAFAALHKRELGPECESVLSEFAGLRHGSFCRRKSFIARTGLWPDYWLHTLAFILLL
jgi:glycosyl transferase family 2